MCHFFSHPRQELRMCAVRSANWERHRERRSGALGNAIGNAIGSATSTIMSAIKNNGLSVRVYLATVFLTCENTVTLLWRWQSALQRTCCVMIPSRKLTVRPLPNTPSPSTLSPNCIITHHSIAKPPLEECNLMILRCCRYCPMTLQR